ncbi:MAG: phenol hydroxylase subunit [Pseudomonadota bacterium]|nr:phenol hydroxylase subunit [Pseudomonadota bacterium]
MSTAPAPTPPPPDLPHGWDVGKRYVRIVQRHASGMVEFEFAVGEPGLFVEMVMPRAQFDEFCAAQGVTPTQGRLPGHEDGSAAHEWDWSLRDAREQRFRKDDASDAPENTR